MSRPSPASLRRRLIAPRAAPIAALGPNEFADAVTNIATHLDAAATLASQRLADVSDAAAVVDLVDAAGNVGLDALGGLVAGGIDGVAAAGDAVDAFTPAAAAAASDTVAVASSFADAMDAVNGTDAAAATNGPQRMEGILSPVSDTLEAFVLGAQDVFAKTGVPYPLGTAIIFTTFTVKALTYPFTKAQIESTLNIQNLQPQVDAIRKRYENDTERMNIEINRIYEENEVSPLNGCIPILLTLPVVWGLYRAFNNASIDGSFDEPWFFIPSLAGPDPDRTLNWLLPLDENYQPPIGWHDASLYLIVPVLTVISQYVSMNLLQPPKDENDPKADEKEQQSVLLNLLPLFIGYISLTVPAGLTLYWLFNNIFTTATQVYLRQGGGAVAKIEKTESVKIKVPLGCAMVDLETMEQQSREEEFAGPYVVWGDGEVDAGDAADAAAGGEALAAAMSSSGFYTTAEERKAEAEKWATLLANRGKRPRNAADRDIATPAELREVIAAFEAAGDEAAATEIRSELTRLEALGGEEYIAKIKAEGAAVQAAEEEKAMKEAIANEPMGGLPSMEELKGAVITVAE